MKRIRRRDGTEAVVDDAYVIQDGESFSIPLTMMDSRPSMVCDSRGMPAGQRPGFLFGGDEAIEQARADAYREYNDAICGRWRGPQEKPSEPSRHADAASVANAYRQYEQELCERWRR